MRGPASVLVDRYLAPFILRQGHESLAVFEIEDKGLLAKDVFARMEAFHEDGQTILRVRRDVDHLDVVAGQ